MPIYEYYCDSCSKKFELLRQVCQASEAGDCPQCHGQAKRILSTFAAMAKDESGQTMPLSDPCGGCSSASCNSCGF